jgi:hypothetical protein
MMYLLGTFTVKRCAASLPWLPLIDPSATMMATNI